MKAVLKMTWRSMRTFFGRFLALLLIVAISVGFFAGLKITKDAMSNTAQNFLTEQNFYDFRLLSTLGFAKSDIESFYTLSGVSIAEGANTVDVMIDDSASKHAVKFISIPDEVNLPSLVAGRMPTSENECLADKNRYGEDDIGKVITVSEENGEDATSALAVREFTIVGIADSPLYIGIDRGSANVGSGTLYAFLYIPKESFAVNYYTEINLMLAERADIYSDEYDEIIKEHKAEVSALCENLADERYNALLAEAGVTEEFDEMLGISAPETYVLTRNENAGYVSFENDTAIVSGIANIFPVFFILIAMLVCITTMTRMVDEERTQIGVLKAMGFGNGAIMSKYLLYAGSATLIGWVLGFFVCTWGLPKIFWFAYNSLYDFASLSYLFSAKLALITLAVSLIGILGSTYISCRKELVSEPAKLIRPRTGKSGKRIFLERVTPIWNRLKFLQKIVLRNMFRYKQRLFMMIVGISCCAGLVVTAFGVRDSMIDIGTLQFEYIQKYQIEASFAGGEEEAVAEKLATLTGVDSYLMGNTERVDLTGEENMNSVNLLSFRAEDDISSFWDFKNGEESVAFPKTGEAIVNTKVAEKLKLEVGDTFVVRDTDMQIFTVRLSGIFDNYVYNYVVISEETYSTYLGEWRANTAMIATDGTDIAKTLTSWDEIKSVSNLADSKETVDSALSCLNYIIWLVVLFSGALAFIVIFNLTNINIAERSREIATVQVLGFYPKETERYVLRENLILSVVASIIGLPLGTLFHHVVMSMITVDSFSFNIYVSPFSYMMAFVCTVLFAVIVNAFMKRSIGKIHMAESLKAVE